MIKFENTVVMGFEGAIRGMRNPLNSLDKSDSVFVTYWGDIDGHKCFDSDGFHIGNNDLDLMKRLIRAGSEHRKFLRQIFVSVDVTAPLYWWKEFDTYKVGTVSNSCSTMHKLASKTINLDDFSVDDFTLAYIGDTIIQCERLRLLYQETKNPDYWRALIQLLPSSYNQKRTITMDYENVYSMYRQRKNHKLSEWSQDFIAWATGLPCAAELGLVENENEATQREEANTDGKNY